MGFHHDVYISSVGGICEMSSPKKRVALYTIITTIITLILGVYIFVELNFVVGFLIVLFAALIYYSRKRLEGIR
jgi:ABC-type Mn2+/Zn2+ transport system permease subunit